MTYPYTYDADSDLFGNLVNQRSLVLTSDVTAGATVLTFESTDDLPLPTWLKIESEIVYATAEAGTDQLTVQRGVLNTVAATHSVGTMAFVVLTSQHFMRIQNRAKVVQTYGGIVGLDAKKANFIVTPAPGDNVTQIRPQPGEVYIATNTKKVYVCITPGRWSFLGGVTEHSELLVDGETDDHTQYFTSARATTWHNNIKAQTTPANDHVTGGDSHDHKVTGAARIRSGATASRPAAPEKTGALFYDTTTKELSVGSLSGATLTWAKVTGDPKYAIIMMMAPDATTGGCPPGWTRYTQLDSKFPKGTSKTTGLTTGGDVQHYHTYDKIPYHHHNIPEATNIDSDKGDSKHHHTIRKSDSGSTGGLTVATGGDATDMTPRTNDGTKHSHSASYPTADTGQAKSGSTTASKSSDNTSIVSNIPSYQEVFFCEKS